MKQIRNNRGSVTFIAVMMMVMLTMIGVAAIKLANDEITIAGNEMNETLAFYAAESGLERAAAALQSYYELNGGPPSSFPAGSEQLTDATSAYVSGVDGAAEMRKLSQGSLAGLNGLVQSYTIRSIGTSLIDAGQVTLAQAFEVALVPIFQFAVFFHEDLWTQPAFNMEITGRVHVNGDIYLRSSAGYRVWFQDRVTCAGDIHVGFPYSSSVSGDIGYNDASDNFVSMKQDGQWLDSDDPDWYEEASALWGGQVQDQSFGQEELTLPMAANGSPHKMIERAAGGNTDSYENDATLKIIDGVVYSKIGSVWQDVTATLTADGTITADASVLFYDAHEKKGVRNLQLDMAKLKSSAYFPSNGVIYISDQRTAAVTGYSSVLNGTTLINGSDIGKPLTVACENPLYIRGDFNTTNKQPVAALTDAMTFLSNSWDPAKSTMSYTSRVASKTTANIAFVTGDLAPAGTNYGGGLENLPRFLEDWDGTEFVYKGSMIEGWRSQQATGTWRYIYDLNPYYSAPTRMWSFDTDFNDPAKLPPQSPTIQIFQRTGWQQENVGYSSAATSSIDVIK